MEIQTVGHTVEGTHGNPIMAGAVRPLGSSNDKRKTLKPLFCFRTHRPGETGSSGSGPLPLKVSHPSLLITTYHLHAVGAHKGLAWG